MAGLTDYTTGAPYINGQLLAEAATIDIDRKGGGINVFTLAKGFAGKNPGARYMEIKISCAVPRVGLEYDPGTVIEGLVPVEVAIYAGSKTLTTKGYIDEDAMKIAINAESTISLSITAVYAQWQ